MGTITRININNLFWLGRYTERVFITLNSFFRYSDKIIESGDEFYGKYLADINVPNIYNSFEDFFDRYVFDENDPNSIYSNLERALGNGIVLREEIKTPSLSYLQMAADKFRKCRGTDKIRYDLLPVRDAIYAFWGSVDNNMTDIDALRIIHLGKSLERVDMMLRLSLPADETLSELDNLLRHVSRYKERCKGIINNEALSSLEEVLDEPSTLIENRLRLIENIESLFEVNFIEAAAV